MIDQQQQQLLIDEIQSRVLQFVSIEAVKNGFELNDCWVRIKFGEDGKQKYFLYHKDKLVKKFELKDILN